MSRSAGSAASCPRPVVSKAAKNDGQGHRHGGTKQGSSWPGLLGGGRDRHTLSDRSGSDRQGEDPSHGDRSAGRQDRGGDPLDGCSFPLRQTHQAAFEGEEPEHAIEKGGGTGQPRVGKLRRPEAVPFRPDRQDVSRGFHHQRERADRQRTERDRTRQRPRSQRAEVSKRERADPAVGGRHDEALGHGDGGRDRRTAQVDRLPLGDQSSTRRALKANPPQASRLVEQGQRAILQRGRAEPSRRAGAVERRHERIGQRSGRARVDEVGPSRPLRRRAAPLPRRSGERPARPAGAGVGAWSSPRPLARALLGRAKAPPPPRRPGHAWRSGAGETPPARGGSSPRSLPTSAFRATARGEARPGLGCRGFLPSPRDRLARGRREWSPTKRRRSEDRLPKRTRRVLRKGPGSRSPDGSPAGSAPARRRPRRASRRRPAYRARETGRTGPPARRRATARVPTERGRTWGRTRRRRGRPGRSLGTAPSRSRRRRRRRSSRPDRRPPRSSNRKRRGSPSSSQRSARAARSAAFSPRIPARRSASAPRPARR